MKMLEYETANPGQDFDEHEKENFDPEKHTIRPPPVVNIQSSETLAQDKYGAPEPTLQRPDTLYYVPDEAKAMPDSSNAGEGRRGRMGNTDVYDAAPGVGAGMGVGPYNGHV